MLSLSAECCLKGVIQQYISISCCHILSLKLDYARISTFGPCSMVHTKLKSPETTKRIQNSFLSASPRMIIRAAFPPFKVGLFGLLGCYGLLEWWCLLHSTTMLYNSWSISGWQGDLFIIQASFFQKIQKLSSSGFLCKVPTHYSLSSTQSSLNVKNLRVW